MVRRAPEVELSEAQRRALVALTRLRTTALAMRARIVLACAAGAWNKQVAAAFCVEQVAAGKWRRRFIARSVDGLYDEPKPDVPRKITERQIKRGVQRCERELEQAIFACIDARNEDPKPFKWLRTADDILEAVSRFCLRTSPENYEAYL